MLSKKLRNNTILMRTVTPEMVCWLLLGMSVLYISMMNAATMAENKVFWRVIVRHPNVNSVYRSHQETHRLGVTPQALDEVFVIGLCLGPVQFPICGGWVTMFRDRCRCLDHSRSERYISSVASESVLLESGL